LFFLQAEDGIRDWSVTGVQTCALPICQVAVLRDSVERLAPAEVARSHLLRQFLPPERCRNRRARLRPDRVDRGDGLPMAILAVVHENSTALLLEPLGRHEPRVLGLEATGHA